MRHAYGNANGDGHIHADGDCHSHSHCDGHCHIHADSDCDSNIYCNGYRYSNCYRNSDFDRTAAAFTDATASAHTAAACGQLLF
jgi:hypothetical protein